MIWDQDDTESATGFNPMAAGGTKKSEGPTGGPAGHSFGTPTAPANHVVEARIRPSWVGHSPARIGFIPVQTPLPHIAIHIEQTPGIGLEPPHWGCVDITILAGNRMPRIIQLFLGRQIIAIRIMAGLVGFSDPIAWRLRTCPSSIFPFRLGRQALMPAGFTG